MRKIIIAAVALFGALGVVLALAGSASAATHTIGSLSDVDLTQSRSAGHADLQADGLHVWTDDASSLAKVAGYVPVSIPLGSVAAGAAPSMNYTVTTGIAPGQQLVFTYGGHTAILVGESVYGDKWWVSDSGCGTWCATLPITWSGGGGSAHSATLAEWSAGMPGASVNAYGFSLGSGVHASGVVKSLTLAGTTYKFKLKSVVVPPSSIAPSSTTATSTTKTTSTSPTSATSTAPTSVLYENCDAVRAAGKAPLSFDQPGYRPDLDSDHDGVACEATDSAVVAVPVVNDTPRDSVGTKTSGLAYTGTSVSPGLVLSVGLGLILLGVGSVAFITYRRRHAQR